MGHNYTAFTIKKIENLVIPMSAFEKHLKENDEKPEIVNIETMEVEINCGCEQSFKGNIKDGNLHVTDIDMYGEGSGNFMYDYGQEIFKQSSGYLKARVIWEGQEVFNMIVDNGNYLEEEV